VVTYETQAGRRATVNVGTKCDDLWVSPDGRAISFIAIEQAKPGSSNEIGPFIERSSVYFGLRSQDFKPLGVAAKPTINGMVWNVAREPKLSPDLRSVYFLVPNYMTSLQLTRTAVRGDSYERIADVSEYCVVWGGKYSGDLIILVAHDSEQSGGGVTYPCYWRQGSGTQVELAAECSASFKTVVAKWSEGHGGICR
jgi:hypothetical protein